MPSKDILFNDSVCTSVTQATWEQKAWLIKLSRFGSIPVQRIPKLLINSLSEPMVGVVAVPNHPDYLLAVILNKESGSYFRNTYYCTISVISTEVKDTQGNCVLLVDNLPTDTHLMLLKKEGEFMGMDVTSSTKFQPADLNKLGLLIVTTPQPLEQASKFLVN